MVCRQANFHSLWRRLTGAIQGEANWEGKILADVISKTTDKLSPEVRERAVRLVLDTEGQIERCSAGPKLSAAWHRPFAVG